MTTLSLIVGSLVSGQASSATTATTYSPIGGYPAINTAVEASLDSTMREAGTFSNMYVRITANAASTTFTFNLRGNLGADTLTETKSVASGTTGEFEDTINSDAITAGHTYDIQCVPGVSNTGAVTCSIIRLLFNTTTNTSTRMTSVDASAYTAASTTYYKPLAGASFSKQTTEATTKCRQRLAGTYQNLMTRSTSNTRTAATTVGSRIDTGGGSGPGNLSVSITAATNNIFEDLIHSDGPLSVGNDYNLSVATGSDTAKTITINETAVSFVSTAGHTYCLNAQDVGRSPNTTATRYYGVGGDIIATTTESNAQMKAGENKQFSNLCVLVTANSTGSSTFTFRKNATNGNMSQSPTASTTGVFTDTVNVDYVAPTDEVNYSYQAGAASGVTLAWMAVWAVKGYSYSASDSPALTESKQRTVIRPLSE